MVVEEELLAFDFGDLVNGFGGALGFFLGWSLLLIFNQFIEFVHKCYKILIEYLRMWVLVEDDKLEN